jgi:hypothetical protein
MPWVRAANELGVTSDAEFGRSGFDTQQAYSDIALTMKTHGSTYAINGLNYAGTIALRKEAAAQHVTSVKVWDCPLGCYDRRLISEAQGATEGQYIVLPFLPFEDGNANPELANFLRYDDKPDAFGAQAWVAGEIFARAVNDAIRAHGDDPNAITRANVLEATRNLHSFDAGGFIPEIDVGGKVGSTCVVVVQVQGDRFVRVDPAEPNTFDCDDGKPPVMLTLDPLEEYGG